MTSSDLAADDRAPVYSRHEVMIAADPDTIWEVMASVEQWPRWNPDVREATIHGDVAVGVDFVWKAGPGTIHSTFRAVDRPNLLGWTGKTLGIPAIHVYRLEATGRETKVVFEESWSGALARVFKRPLQKTLDKAVTNGLRALKTEAERRATE